jgi:hypothetical protein
MKKLLFAIALTASCGIIKAQSVDVTLTLAPVASLTTTGNATMEFNTLAQWDGTEIVNSTHVYGTAVFTGATNTIEVSSTGFSNPLLNPAIAVIVDHGAWGTDVAMVTPNVINYGAGSHPLDIWFGSGYASVIGVPAGTYTSSYTLAAFSY